MSQAITTVSVKDYGAVGDGTADDTVAINNALATFNGVYFPPGIYRTSNSLVVKSSQRLFGDGRSSIIKKLSGDFSMIVGNGVDDVLVERLALEGDYAGTTTPNANGVYFGTSTNIIVRGCYFEKFGNNQTAPTASVGSAICCTSCEYIRIDGNTISGGAGDVGDASDILLFQDSGNAVITRNTCLSGNSQGIFVNASASDPIGKIAVLGNITKNHRRHGIVAAYTTNAGGMFNTIISNNLVSDNGQTGIYLNAVGTGSAGTVSITDDIVERCGNRPYGFGTDGGIVVGGTGGVVLITNNMVREIGQEQPEDENTPGILVNAAFEPIVLGNTVEECKNGGVWFIKCKRITLKGCMLRANGAYQIRIEGASEVVPDSIVLTDNRIVSDGIDAVGIRAIDWDDQSAVRVIVADNEIVGIGEESTATGIAWVHALLGTWEGNVIANYDIGIEFGNTASDALGGDLLFSNNRISACGTGVKVNFSSSPDSYGFSLQNQLSGNGTSVGGATAARLKMSTSVYPTKTFVDTAAPTTGTWAVGDTVMNSTPSTGAPLGWMCTVGGAPGTWKAMPNLL